MELSDEWVVTQWSGAIRAGVRRSGSSRFTRAGNAGDEGRGQLEAVGRLTSTVGIEFRGKRIPRSAELIRVQTGKIDEGSSVGSAGGGDTVTITAGIVELTKWHRLTLIRQELPELGEWIRQDFWAESTGRREEDDRAIVRSLKVDRANSTREDRNFDEDEGRKSIGKGKMDGGTKGGVGR